MPAVKDAAIEIKLNAYVLPDGHRVFKLFPGRRYRLSNEVYQSRTAFLDINGIVDALGDDPLTWTDDGLRRVITQDRILQAAGSKVKKRTTAEDTKRLGYIKTLVFDAAYGDLIVVPLGKGLDGDVAIGEFDSEPGKLTTILVKDGDSEFVTVGRSVKWRTVVKRSRFSSDLNKSLHAPTAIHLIGRSHKEALYVAAYGSFTYDDIYVASFPTEKERLTTTDQARIGVWFNALAVIHKYETNGSRSSGGLRYLRVRG